MVKSRQKIQKIRLAGTRVKKVAFAVIITAFAGIGGLIILTSRAAPSVCSTQNVVGTATYNVSVPENGQYKLWVRAQVPNTDNTNNLNGVRLELTGSSNQCFTVTTTAPNAVNAWQWLNADATASTTPHVTSQISAGNYTVKLLGLKAGVKVDKVLLLPASDNCIPSNVVSGSVQPGDNCTTPAPTVTITANSTTVQSGQSTTLNWASTNATSCTASGAWSGTRATNGNMSTGTLTSTSTFTIGCSGIGGTSSPVSVTVNVTPVPAPTVSFSANPTSITSGGSSILTWSSTNATSCTASGGANGWAGAKSASGSQSTGNLSNTQTFSLSCVGPGGTTQASPVTVTVAAAPPTDTQKPVVNMNVLGVTIPTGQSSVRVSNQKSITWRPLVSDNVGLASVEYRVNDQVVSLSNGAYTFGGQPNGNGDYVLRVVARDAQNNKEEVSITIQLRYPDINRDGIIDSSDFNGLLRNWGRQSTNYDLNGRDGVDSSDFNILLRNWGPTQ